MKIFAKVLLALAMPVLLSGCILTANSYRETNTFDLRSPVSASAQNQVAIGIFRNDSPTRTHLLYRENGTKLVVDEYNNWVQTPELMLQRYFTAAFPLTRSERQKLIQLSGAVQAFEIDLAQPAAVLAFEYTLTQNGKSQSGSITVTERADAHTPEAYANAMTRAAEHAVRNLSAAIALFANGK